jgi:hypothetical protein
MRALVAFPAAALGVALTAAPVRAETRSHGPGHGGARPGGRGFRERRDPGGGRQRRAERHGTEHLEAQRAEWIAGKRERKEES